MAIMKLMLIFLIGIAFGFLIGFVIGKGERTWNRNQER